MLWVYHCHYLLMFSILYECLDSEIQMALCPEITDDVWIFDGGTEQFEHPLRVVPRNRIRWEEMQLCQMSFIKS